MNRFAIQLSLIAAGLLALLVAVVVVRHRPDVPAAPAPQGDPVRIFTTVYVLGDLARTIGGRYVDVTSAVQSGDSLDDYSFDDTTRRPFRMANLCIIGGLTEPWALREIDAPFASDRLIRFDQLSFGSTRPTTINSRAPGSLLWLDPQMAKRACVSIAQHLTIARPDHNVYFTSLSNRLSSQIDETVATHVERLNAIPAARRKAIALTTEFDDLALAMGIELIHPLTVKGNAGALDDSQIRRLRAAAREAGVRVILMPANSIAIQASEVSRQTQTQATVLDPFGSPSIAGHTTYVELLDSNLTQLEQAMTTP